MSMEVFMRGLLSAFFSLLIAWLIFLRNESELGYNDHQRYLPYVSGMLLPSVILAFGLLGLCFYGVQRTASMMLSMSFVIFLHTSIFYAILLLLLPLLRKRISARACAMLWMIPNYLYFTQQKAMELQKPLWVVRAPGSIVWGLFTIWVTGFIFVFGWKMIAHLSFREKILKDAEDVRDPEILAILEQEVRNANYPKPKFKLVRSTHVDSPLSVGLFRRSIRIVLPDRDFSEEELKLIFRHELIHIGREDAWSKFFLMFCTAMCWFNPLMWIAMHKSADDLELSCDETVLLGCNDVVKRQYAKLILETAGDDRGFTTCLSAAASTMRYRLKAIMQPVKRRSGALTVGLISFVLWMSCGYIALAYGEHTGSEVIFSDLEHSLFTLDKVKVEGGEYDTAQDTIDTAAINEYLAELTMLNMTGNFSFSDDQRFMEFQYSGPAGIFRVQLNDSYVRILPLHGEKLEWSVYYLPEGVDWAYLDSLAPELPVVEIELFDQDYLHGKTLEATVTRMVCLANGSSQVIKFRELQDGEGSGIYGYDPARAVFRFSHPLLSEMEILVESWDHEISYVETLSGQNDAFSVSLPDYDAHYTIHAVFQGQDGMEYDMEFCFDIGDTGRLSE